MNHHAAIIGRPNTETAVYLLLGMLWDHIPNKFSFEEFEVSPRKHNYGHTKHLDARGKELIKDKWVAVNFEFKLNSRGLLADIKKHPELHATWLICWKHDAPEAEKYVERVLCLEDIYNSLPDIQKHRILSSSLQLAVSHKAPQKHSHPAIVGTPSAETATYFLLGLMWDHIPHIFGFEEFEPNPVKHGYNHTKILDARGKELVNGRLQDVNFEFKLKSSGVFKDLRLHPNFNATWLVCWQHDAPGVERYVERILILEDVYKALPFAEQNRIVSKPTQQVKITGIKTSVAELVSRFSARNQDKVKQFIAEWNHQTRGYTSEVVLLNNDRPLIRLVAYSSEHVLIKATLPIELRQKLVSVFSAREMEVNNKLKLLLDDLDQGIISLIVNAVNARQQGEIVSTPSIKVIESRNALNMTHHSASIDMDIVAKFNLLGVKRNSGEPGTPVLIKWSYKGNVVELRYSYKMGWSFDGYYLNGNLIEMPQTFSSRDSARNCYLQDAFNRI